ncbi:uncharacterized protein LOC125945623 [Dermacentor silvarum]|uniref:uncharacterized protein LOC125945623 n=1 Tax=Dermacentor silvarum TaxID=543639 RepID=UPI00210101A8|nr:uncharacterized protein LOC125945623 [Dermacentor silvarum]
MDPRRRTFLLRPGNAVHASHALYPGPMISTTSQPARDAVHAPLTMLPAAVSAAYATSSGSTDAVQAPLAAGPADPSAAAAAAASGYVDSCPGLYGRLSQQLVRHHARHLAADPTARGYDEHLRIPQWFRGCTSHWDSASAPPSWTRPAWERRPRFPWRDYHARHYIDSSANKVCRPSFLGGRTGCRSYNDRTVRGHRP